MFKLTYIFFCLLFTGLFCSAQEYRYSYPDSITIDATYLTNQANKLVKKKLAKLVRYEKRETNQTRKLVNRLAKKEHKLLKQCKSTDSLSLKQLTQTVGFDSIKQMMNNTASAKFVKKSKNKFDKSIDSLKKVSALATNTLSKASTILEKVGIKGGSMNEINSLESKLDYNQYVQELIQGRTNNWMQVGGKVKGLDGLKGISKQYYYYNQKLKGYKEIANDPSKIEEMALGYLQGIQGFNEAMQTPSLSQSGSVSQGMQSAHSEADLQKMGYQTKSQVRAHMNKQFNLKKPEEMEKLNSKLGEARKQVSDYSNQISSTKNQIKNLGFKPNPMRGKPFVDRLEKSFTWQVLRPQGLNPATFEANGLLGFKHTGSLTYGLIGGLEIGLGRDWQHIKLFFEGLRLGANIDWKWIWGISGQAGLERLYKKYSQTTMITTNEGTPSSLVNETKYYRDIAYTGIQKTYKINSKYSGTMLLAYDWLWKQGNAKSPIIWRVGWKK